MPFEQTPSPVVPARTRPLPWSVPLSGGTGVLLLLVFAATESGPHAERAFVAALAAAGVTLVLTIQAFRFAAIQRAEAAQVQATAAPEPAVTEAPGLQALLDALPDPILVISALEFDDIVGRRVVYGNGPARELFRLQKDGGLLVTAIRDPEVLDAVDEALFGGVSRSVLYETGGAQNRVWRALARPLEAAGDKRRLAILTLHDETDSRRMERMRADFLANASHELRTPLASLSGFIETLRGHAKDDPVARDRFLAIMSAQAERMSRLIKDLMSLSRVELNEHIPPQGSVDLVMATNDVLDGLAPIAAERGVRMIQTGAERDVAQVAGDRDEIVQVVQNLVDNGLKYSPSGGDLTVEVETDVDAAAASTGRIAGSARLSLLTPDRAEGTRFALVRVTDRGPGIAREHLPRLTERFYRVEGQKSGERLGTGLGLAIVKHIVNRHRGGLFVESVPGEGASFVAYLPLHVGPRRGQTVDIPTPDEAETGARNKTVAEPS